MNYEVTIGIPLYNAGRYIRRTLESALAQTFGSIEFLILDDCGTDNSVDIVRGMQDEHPRGRDIHIVSQPRNMGVGPARNRIIDEARGRYLYFMDSDDIIAPQTIEILHDSLVTNDAEIAFGSYEKIEASGGDERRSEVYSYPDAVLTDADSLASFAFRKYGGIQASACNYLVSLDLLRNTGHRFIESKYWEDMVFTYILTTYVSRAVLRSDITYYYMCRENSLSNYQCRKQIRRDEVLGNVATIDHLKRHAVRIAGKPYLGNWCYNVVMTDFYIVCNVIKNRGIISPALGDGELRGFMNHPLGLRRILGLGHRRFGNLFLYLLGKLPPKVFVRIVKILGKRKGLI